MVSLQAMVSRIQSVTINKPYKGGWYTTLFQTEISTQLLDALLCNFVEIHGPQTINPNDFWDPLTFPLASL